VVADVLAQGRLALARADIDTQKYRTLKKPKKILQLDVGLGPAGPSLDQ
jgi:hypothetical protein